MRATLKALSVFLYCAAFLLAAEVYVRIKKPDIFRSLQARAYSQPDLTFDHSLVPRGKGRFKGDEFDIRINVNSSGFRGPELARDKTAGRKRIVFVGDSFTFGWGVNEEETFVSLLQKDQPAELINAGIVSYSPALEYLLIREKIIALQPDEVVLCLDQSDLQDDYKYSDSGIFKDGVLQSVRPIGRFAPNLTSGFENPFLRFLARHSAFFIYADKKIKVWQGIPDPASRKLPLVQGNIERDRFFFLREHPVDFDQHWMRTERYLTLIAEMLHEHGIKFSLVIYPYGHQVAGDEWADRTTYQFAADQVYAGGPVSERLREFARNRELSFIDLRESLIAYKKAHPAEKLYFAHDGHWTLQGHRVVAAALQSWLRAGG